MSQVRVAAFGLSIDGFSAGPLQSLDDPLEPAREAVQCRDVRFGGGGRPFANICEPVWWTRFTGSFRRSCWGWAKPCSRAWDLRSLNR